MSVTQAIWGIWGIMPTTKKQARITITPELQSIIDMYMSTSGTRSLGAALAELIALGWAYQLEGLPAPHPKGAWSGSEERDIELWNEWEAEQGDKRLREQEDFALWYARRAAPKWGGKR